MKIESVTRIVLALLSGVLASTAFAPLSWWPILAVSLLLLWQLWYARPGWAFFCVSKVSTCRVTEVKIVVHPNED